MRRPRRYIVLILIICVCTVLAHLHRLSTLLEKPEQRLDVVDKTPSKYQSTVNNWIASVQGNTEICKKYNFVSIQCIGGLGNIMYEYANLVAFCLTYNCIPVLSGKMVMKTSLRFPFLQVPRLEHVKQCNFSWIEKFYFTELSQLWEVQGKDEVNSYYLRKFPRGSSYFMSYYDLIKREFRFPVEVQRRVDKSIESIMKEYNTDIVVGIHVRRQNMVGIIHRAGGVIVDADYILRAMNFTLERRPQSVFAVITDDLPWCKENVVGEKYRIVFPGDDMLFDLAFISSCNHSIYTHGSFGFFGSYFANGDLVYPENFSSYTPSELMILREYKLPNWFALPGHIKKETV